jgi:hypothetical protein
MTTRKKSLTLKLVPVVASAALTLGCRDNSWDQVQQRQACLDAGGHVVDPSLCAPNPYRHSAGFYHWYVYGYHGGRDPYAYRGSAVVVPASGGVGFHGGVPAGSSSVTRGGFGSSADGHGAGE